MKKSDLNIGNVVELRTGAKLLYSSVCAQQLLIPLDGNGCLDYEARYSNGLKHKAFCDLDIMKVYEDYTCKELLWERKEKPILTEDEKTILRNIDKDYKWIARDKDGTLGFHYVKPHKEAYFWSSLEANYLSDLFPNLFKFIKWEDDEPYLISDLII